MNDSTVRQPFGQRIAGSPCTDSPSQSMALWPARQNEQLRPMAGDEIAVDGYLIKPEVRGTGRDPRALKTEQWLVKVRMLDDGRRIQVHADRAQWEKLRENDRAKVTYRMGKYTGTVWDAEID